MGCPTGHILIIREWTVCGTTCCPIFQTHYPKTKRKRTVENPNKVKLIGLMYQGPNLHYPVTLRQIQGQLVGFDLTPKFKLLLFKTGRQQQKPSKNYIMQKFAGFQPRKDFDFSPRMWKLHFWESNPHAPLSVIQQSFFSPLKIILIDGTQHYLK